MKILAKSGALLTLVGLVVGLSACEPSPPTAIATSTTIGCGFGTLSADTDWYLPAGTPRGMVWLQHGFTESKSDWGQVAQQLAQKGMVVFAPTLPTANIYGCTVENVGNNTDFLNNVADLFVPGSAAHGELTKSFAAATAKVGRSDLALPNRFAVAGHSAGGEAVLYVANRLRTASPAAFGNLTGIVLDDPVKSFVGTNTDTALAGLNTTSLPILALASPPYSCNSNQSGTLAVEELLTTRSFHGALVVSGAHGDVFGSSANSVENTTCGTPQAQNVAAVQGLTTAWLVDDVNGTHTAADYPGGATYDGYVQAGTISTLP